MKLRRLGRSPIRISPLALGTMNFGSDWHGVGAINEKQARYLVDTAYDAGVNFIDTADIYGYGAAEKFLGEILKGRRDKFILASKLLGEMRPGDSSSGGLSKKRVAQALDESLRRLRTDYLDLYMPHAIDPKVPWAESLEALDRAVTAGKVRVLGCSNFMRNDWATCLKWAEDLGRPRMEFNQSQFSVAASFMEKEIASFCGEHETGFLAWSPLGGGLLSGKYMGETRPAGRRQNPAQAFPPLDEGRLAGPLTVLKKVAGMEGGLSMAQAAVGWILAKPWVTSIILGARTPLQLEELLSSRPISPKAVSLLDRLSSALLVDNPA